MYGYYIAMQIYVFIFINIFSPFYCLCIISMLHHSPTMNFTWTTPKPFKTKNSTPFTILFHKISHSYNNFFLSKWRCFQRSQTPTYILTKKKLNKKFPKVYTSHAPSMWFHMHNKMQRLFTWFSHKLICEGQCTSMCKRFFTWLSHKFSFES
jgi:hypothetical protein